MLQLTWAKCGDDLHWCALQHLDLTSITPAIGVYIIWHDGNPGRIVRVGQGNIANRLSAHRHDADILAYAVHGTLRVTWASAPAHRLDGIERYLAERWTPLVGDAYPDAEPIEVNSPFAVAA